MKRIITILFSYIFVVFLQAYGRDWPEDKVVEIDGIAYHLLYDLLVPDCEGNEYYEIIDRYAVVAPLHLLDGGSESKYSGNVVIPNNLEYDGFTYGIYSLEENCFVDCNDLESVTIAAFGYIPDSAFRNCPKLKKIDLSGCYNDCTLGSYAIAECPELKEFTLPSGITDLDAQAIEASGLEKIELPETLYSIGAEALCLPSLKELICHVKTPIVMNATNPFGCGEKGINLKECTLRVPAESVEAYKSANYWKDFGQILPIEETGIAAAEAEAESGKAYDLLGRQASGKGVRIVNGKKMLVR